jgi:hypothetical protein
MGMHPGLGNSGFSGTRGCRWLHAAHCTDTSWPPRASFAVLCPKKSQMYELWNDYEEVVWLWEGVLWGLKGCDMLGMALAPGHGGLGVKGCRRGACALAEGQENPRIIIQRA